MEKLKFDSGVREYQINDGGILRFNPSDPNVYDRLVDTNYKLQEVEKRLVEKGAALKENGTAEAVIKIMAEADKEAKALLNWVFGGDNDFDKLFSGVNVMAVGENGERIITNFLAVITPIIEDGAQRCADEKANQAAMKARAARAARKAR